MYGKWTQLMILGNCMCLPRISVFHEELVFIRGRRHSATGLHFKLISQQLAINWRSNKNLCKGYMVMHCVNVHKQCPLVEIPECILKGQSKTWKTSSLSKISQPASLSDSDEDVRLVQLAFTLRLSIFQTAVANAQVFIVKNTDVFIDEYFGKSVNICMSVSVYEIFYTYNPGT